MKVLIWQSNVERATLDNKNRTRLKELKCGDVPFIVGLKPQLGVMLLCAQQPNAF